MADIAILDNSRKEANLRLSQEQQNLVDATKENIAAKETASSRMGEL